ncbi:hypothetical protein FDE29_13785 [Vibrio parahaemolyticus]|uniref:hypothetical protein n=1 Tax=Vibrio parahaemolyticus TaxID=670 RepID=UPI0011225288|nr:hypothetical protein [Vibrio parahaemolyticus]EGR0437970.1 hypothetical protein [Vibrio parahaemolyticus]MDZ5208983.1 hypothetical protein [Vibrio parahaemolyticus]MQC34080.1 hypothetical protein [Vibrio parahaemolyticus]MQC43380.1 hypothetical protein [Vibrio parahaemolyticus]MQC56813.1 hypothetical protein [Vibrio parahaemolyticus]
MNTELKQAQEVLTKANEVLEESKLNLRKSQSFNELMVAQNRRLSFALTNLLPKNSVINMANGTTMTFLDSSIDVELTEEDLQFLSCKPFELHAEEIAKSFKQRQTLDIVHAINVLAMSNTDVIHVFTEFAPHANSFTVNVFEGTQHYNTGEKFTFLLQELVFLNDKKALESLLAIESQVTELIIEAREQAEAKAKEYHPKHCIHGAILYGKCMKCAEASEGGEA